MTDSPIIPDSIWTTGGPTPSRVRVVHERIRGRVVLERLTGRRKGHEIVVTLEQLHGAFHPEVEGDA